MARIRRLHAEADQEVTDPAEVASAVSTRLRRPAAHSHALSRCDNVLAGSGSGVAEVASVIAATDRARAQRIADVIADEYVRALVMAEIAVLTDPAHAEPQVREALRAAHQDPARIVEVAVVAARTSPARAEQIVRSIRSRDNIRTADFWRARALADLVSVSYESSPISI